MPGTYPTSPAPSSVSPAAIIDPIHRYSVDQGYEVSRPKWSRPRRRWTLQYLGATTTTVRIIRDFLQLNRFGALDFAFHHPTQTDLAITQPNTPMGLVYIHGLVTGQYVVVVQAPHSSTIGAWQILRSANNLLFLMGSTAAGITGNAAVRVYVPRCKALVEQDIFDSPSILIGPEQTPFPGQREGIYNFQVVLEELF